MIPVSGAGKREPGHLPSHLNPRRFFAQRRTLRRALGALAAMFAAPIIASAIASPALAADAKRPDGAAILASLPPVAGLALDLAPEARIACLLPAGADPHHFALRPSDRQRLATARLLIRAGRDDRRWPWPSVHAATVELWPDARHGWLAPQAMPSAIDRLARALDAGEKQRRAARAAFRRLLGQWRAALAPARKDGVILQHPAWRPLLEAAGVPVHLTLESGAHGAMPGPRKLDAALRLVRRHPGIWLIGESNHDNRALDWLARHAPRARRLDLDAIGRCGEPLSALWRRNLARWREAIAAQP